MMISQDRGDASDIALRKHLEGEERIAKLPLAEFLVVTVGSEPRDPVVVFIGWPGGFVEQAYPGTAIWQAALRSFLRSRRNEDRGQPGVRAAAAESLERFPTLDRWLHWFDHERDIRIAYPVKQRSSRRKSFWIGQLW